MKLINLFFFINGIILSIIIPICAKKPVGYFELFMISYVEVLALGMTVYFGSSLKEKEVSRKKLEDRNPEEDWDTNVGGIFKHT